MRISDWSSDVCSSDLYPVVSGNVSLYNETNGKGILPTPAIGGVGVLDDVALMATLAFKLPGEAVIVIGATRGHLGPSVYLRDICGQEDGPPPAVDLKVERTHGEIGRAHV